MNDDRSFYLLRCSSRHSSHRGRGMQCREQQRHGGVATARHFVRRRLRSGTGRRQQWALQGTFRAVSCLTDDHTADPQTCSTFCRRYTAAKKTFAPSTGYTLTRCIKPASKRSTAAEKVLTASLSLCTQPKVLARAEFRPQEAL